jgi:hypothetical protein
MESTVLSAWAASSNYNTGIFWQHLSDFWRLKPRVLAVPSSLRQIQRSHVPGGLLLQIHPLRLITRALNTKTSFSERLRENLNALAGLPPSGLSPSIHNVGQKHSRPTE